MKERRFTVNRDGRQMAGLCWGEGGSKHVLAVHGWLDNAASFHHLGPLLEDCEVVALDLAGQGHSDHRPADGEYNIWNDLPDVLAVADELGWQEFALIGHSRGAIVSSLLASAFPDRVQALVMLDAWVAQVVDPADAPRQLRQWALDRQLLPGKEQRIFRELEQAVAVREKSGLQPHAARLVAERNLEQCEGGWRWSADTRIQGASAFKLTSGHSAAIMDGLSMPSLLLLAEGGLAAGRIRENQLDSAAMPPAEIVTGGHHFHMEDTVATVARRILDFLQEARV